MQEPKRVNLDDISEEIENDSELKQILLESNQDIKAGALYSIDEAIQYIREQHSKS